MPDGAIHVTPEDERGRVDLDTYLSFPRQDTVIYCCGPEPLIDAVERRCTTWPAGTFHHERFAPQMVSAKGKFQVQLARSGLQLPVPAGKPLLDVLEDAGFAVTNSCRAGICGTCLLGVVGGVPDHRDDILTDDERAAGDVMLPCVSRSRTPVLVLDL